jgi:cytidyltransferase-like protein
MKIVLVTGGFDPLHSGHIAYFQAAKELGDKLFVGVNSDAWLARKKGRAFMPWIERANIIDSLSVVDDVYEFEDNDGSACDAIRRVKAAYPDAQIIFANGGDRTSYNIPEMSEKDVIFKFGVGGENKANSSSWILEEWKSPKTERPWGYYRVLHELPGTKVKELTILPGQQLSMQRHSQRAEHWFVTEGMASVYYPREDLDTLDVQHLNTHQHYIIAVGQWHQLTNPFDKPCKIIEIQYGDNCVEDDIERR